MDNKGCSVESGERMTRRCFSSLIILPLLFLSSIIGSRIAGGGRMEKPKTLGLLQETSTAGGTREQREPSRGAATHVHAHHQHVFFLCLVCDRPLREKSSADGKTRSTQSPPPTPPGYRTCKRDGRDGGVRAE